MALCCPILAGFIAMAIGDPPGAGSRFLSSGMIASQGKSGFLGALRQVFIAGYLILALRKACENLPEALEKIAPSDLPGCGPSCHRTGYELRRRAGHGRRSHYGVKLMV